METHVFHHQHWSLRRYVGRVVATRVGAYKCLKCCKFTAEMHLAKHGARACATKPWSRRHQASQSVEKRHGHQCTNCSPQQHCATGQASPCKRGAWELRGCQPNCQSVNRHPTSAIGDTKNGKAIQHCEYPTCREDGMHIHVHASPRVVRPRTALHNTTQQVLIVCKACLRHQRQFNQSPRLHVVNCFCGVWRETGVHGWSIFINKRQSTDALRRCTSRKRLN